MAKQFAIPATPPKSALIIDTFMGVDYTNQPSNVDERRSPWAPNMIRDVPGKVRKCMGWESFGALPDRINGIHMLTGKGSIVHAGTSLYWDLTRYAEAKSLSLVVDKNAFRAIRNHGKTEQPGTGDPSPTNIRPISGVGEYRSNGYYTDIVVTTNGVTKTYTIGPMNAPLFDGDVLTWSGNNTAKILRAKGFKTLTGEEAWGYATNNNTPRFGVENLAVGAKGGTATLCSHYPFSTLWPDYKINVYSGGYIDIKDVRFTDTAAFKNNLANQRTQNTPVVIVYELEIPTTETVSISEPITNAEGTVVLTPNRGTISAVVHGVGNNGGIPEYEKIYTGCADARSSSWQYGDKLYLVDGKALLIYDGDKVAPASENAKIPIVTIGKAPSGGGKPLDDLNLLQPKFTEQFLGTETDKVYQLSFPGLDAAAVTVKLLQANGTWVDKKEGTDFTVNRTTGAVTFLQAPGKSPVTGQDNISITASRTISGYADRINHCDIGILYGISGAADRLFLSGNPDNKNYDWFSEQYDFSYFPDTGYAVLGTDHSAIMGYSIINDRLAAHKDDMEDGRNVILRSGQLTDGKPAFPIVGTLQGPGAVAKHTCDYLCTEPLFLTGLGIYAITPADLTGERYANLRSYYINGLLLKEPHLEDAVGISYKDMYWLVLNGTGYILDGLQPQQTDKSAPYATRQYACFHRQGLPARVLWQREGRLWFGTNEGKICRFYNDPDALHSYSDDGQPITCSWRTPYLEGKSFYKNKSFKFLAIRLSSAVATSVKILSQRRGIWTMIKENEAAARYFSWSNVCWSKFSWSPDSTPKTVSGKVRVKKVDKACFEFKNTALNEPFGLMDYALEFVENGKYKG